MSYFLPASMKESRPPLPKSSLTWVKPKRFNFGNFSWMKSTRSATNLRSGMVQRNTHSLPCVVMRCAADDDLRHLVFPEHLRRREAHGARHRAKRNAHVVARREAPRDHRAFLG